MFGLKPNENLLCNEAGWNTAYTPIVLRSFPFALAPTSTNGENVVLCLDTLIDGVNDKEGASLFDERGNETDYLKCIQELLLTQMSQAALTKEFTQYLLKKNLLKTFSFSVKSENSNDYSLAGVYAVNLNEFNKLNAEEFLILRRNGYLPAIYAHLTSLNQVSNLARLKSLKIGK